MPIKLAVIVPALKLPDPLRCTIAFGVFALVAFTPNVISLVLLEMLILEPAINDLKFNVFPVLSLNIKPVPIPTLAPVVDCGRLNKTKEIGSVSIIAVGVSHNQLEPALTVPEVITTYACPAIVPDAKSAGLVQAPDCANHKPFCIGND